MLLISIFANEQKQMDFFLNIHLKRFNIKHFLLIGIMILLLFAACNQSSESNINLRVSNNLLIDTTINYANRDLSLLSITDENWLNTNYSIMDADTFLYQKFFEKTLTLVRNENEKIPIQDIKNTQFKIIYIGKKLPEFESRFAYYSNFQCFDIKDYNWESTSNFDKLILIINQTDIANSNYQAVVNNLYKYDKQLHIINYGKLENLAYFDGFQSVIQSYETNQVTSDFAAQLLFGGIQAKGQLPISVTKVLPQGLKNDKTPIIRLKYTLPQEVGMNPKRLTKIDKIMARAIRKKAAPGGQIMAIKNGKVFYYKSFGTFTYEKKQAVENLDLYDIASITKVAGTTLALMKLYEQNLIEIETRLKTYLPESEKSRLRNLKIRHLLTHRSGLPANAPISKFVRISDTISTDFKAYFANNNSENFPVKITEKQFMNKSVQIELWKAIYKMRLARKRKYHYSDLNFLLLQKVVETQSNQSLDFYLDNQIYAKLGLNYLQFNPLESFEKEQIAPTILDKKWRYKTLQGEVHDEMSALFGGICGNAGLFSNANDLGILFQMLSNHGTYGKEQIFETETIDYFINKKHTGHRALGFDKKGAGCYKGASKGTFGHSGYTGTCVWLDPKLDLIYIFLSNRVHPNPKNTKLMKYKTRELVHREFYKAMN